MAAGNGGARVTEIRGLSRFGRFSCYAAAITRRALRQNKRVWQ